jgi:hypothetical protein
MLDIDPKIIPDPILVEGHIYEMHYEWTKVTTIVLFKGMLKGDYSFLPLACSRSNIDDGIFVITSKKNMTKYLVRELQIEDLPLYLNFYCYPALEKLLREYKP